MTNAKAIKAVLDELKNDGVDERDVEIVKTKCGPPGPSEVVFRVKKGPDKGTHTAKVSPKRGVFSIAAHGGGVDAERLR